MIHFVLLNAANKNVVSKTLIFIHRTLSKILYNICPVNLHKYIIIHIPIVSLMLLL